jgi:Flp pilus assembly protein TadB
MTTPTQIGAPDAYAPLSTAEKLEKDAALAEVATGDALRAVEVAAVVLLGLLVCPPLLILVVVVVVPLLAMALVVGLIGAVISAPYLLVHHLRAHDRRHASLLAQRLRGAGRALVALAPHRIVADARKGAPGR